MPRMRYLAAVAAASAIVAACGSTTSPTASADGATTSTADTSASTSSSPSPSASTSTSSVSTTTTTAAGTTTTSLPVTLVLADPTEYVSAADARVIAGRGGLLLPTRLPPWSSQVRRLVIAAPGDPISLDYVWDDQKGVSLPNNTGYEVQLRIIRGLYDPQLPPFGGRTIAGATRNYVTPWTEGVCPEPNEGNADTASLVWRDATYQYALEALPQPGCFGNFNDLNALVAIADSLVFCGDTNGSFTCTAPAG